MMPGNDETELDHSQGFIDIKVLIKSFVIYAQVKLCLYKLGQRDFSTKKESILREYITHHKK